MAALTPEKAQSFLGNVAADKLFVTNDGLALGNLSELAKALRKMSATTYDHHVTPDRNDFYNWVEYVIADSGLANQLRGATHPKQAAGLVVARIRQLQKALVPEKKAAPEQAAEKPEAKAVQLKKTVKPAVKKAAPMPTVKITRKAVPKPQPKKVVKKAVKKIVATKAVKKAAPPAKKAVPKPAVKSIKKEKKTAQKKLLAVKPVKVALLKKPSAKVKVRRQVDMSKMKKVKQLSRKEVDAIEQHSYLKVRYPHEKMYEQSIIQKHEHVNYKIKEFMYGFIVGFVAALILLRMLRII